MPYSERLPEICSRISGHSEGAHRTVFIPAITGSARPPQYFAVRWRRISPLFFRNAYPSGGHTILYEIPGFRSSRLLRPVRRMLPLATSCGCPAVQAPPAPLPPGAWAEGSGWPVPCLCPVPAPDRGGRGWHGFTQMVLRDLRETARDMPGLLRPDPEQRETVFCTGRMHDGSRREQGVCAGSERHEIPAGVRESAEQAIALLQGIRQSGPGVPLGGLSFLSSR